MHLIKVGGSIILSSCMKCTTTTKIGLKYEPEFVERKEIGKVKGREVKSIKKYFIHRFSDEAICLNFSM